MRPDGRVLVSFHYSFKNSVAKKKWVKSLAISPQILQNNNYQEYRANKAAFIYTPKMSRRITFVFLKLLRELYINFLKYCNTKY